MFEHLARWAVSKPELPADVLHIARLQHIAATGVLRAARNTTQGALCLSSGSGPNGDASIGGMAALLFTNHDDYLLAGRSGVGALPIGWSARARTLGEVLADTVIANEVAGRIGLSFASSHQPGSIDTRVPAVAAAVMRARIDGLSEAETRRQIESAVASGESLPLTAVGTPSSARATAARICSPAAASAGVDPTFPGALGGLGQQWFTRTVVLKPWPGTPWGNVALDGLNTILDRHLKASEKRLRPDQLDRIAFSGTGQLVTSEAAGAALTERSGVAWSIAKAGALLVGLHELSAAHLQLGAAGEKEADILALEPRITVAHEWKLTTRQAVATAESLGPILAERGVREYFRSGRAFTAGFPPPASWWAMFGAQPWRIYKALHQTDSLEGIQLDERCHHFPIEIKLYTTRGGWWPERRVTPVGGGEAMQSVALRKHGDASACAAALSAAPETALGPWLDDLLA